MPNKAINFTGIFLNYTPINMCPYYVFTTEHRYLVRCEDYPKMIGKLSPNTKVHIKGDIGTKLSQGVELLNIKYEVLDE